MSRNKVSILFPFLSLLLFLVLSFLRCTDAKRNPMRPDNGDLEEIVVAAPGVPATLDEDKLLKTRPDETLDRNDVRVLVGRWDNKDKIWVEIPDPNVFLFDFGPEGMKFSRPVRIEISLSKAALAEIPSRNIKVWYLSEGQPRLVDSTVNRRKNSLSFWVKHFSRYALSRE